MENEKDKLAAQPVEAGSAVPHNVYEYGPEGMPRVERMPSAVLDCIINHSLFRYLGAALEGEERDRLYGLMHDTANEVLARLPGWPVTATHPAEPVVSMTVSAGLSAADAEKVAKHGAEVLIREKNALIKAHQAVLAERDAEIAKLRTAAAEPVGGALVAMPRIPTESMLNAARDWSVKKYSQGIGNDAATGCWQAMYDAAKPIPVMQTLTALIETLRPIVQAVGVNDRDTLGSLIGDDSVIFEGSGSWEGSRFVTMGDLRRITDFVRSQQAGAQPSTQAEGK